MMALVLLGLLSGCQSQPVAQHAGQPAPRSAADAVRQLQSAKPLTAEDEQKFVAAAEKAQEMAPAIQAANMFGGLDPTGLGHMAVDAEAHRRSAELQKYMPGMMALTQQRVDAMCKSQPKLSECIQLAQAKAQLETELKKYGR